MIDDNNYGQWLCFIKFIFKLISRTSSFPASKYMQLFVPYIALSFLLWVIPEGYNWVMWHALSPTP